MIQKLKYNILTDFSKAAYMTLQSRPTKFTLEPGITYQANVLLLTVLRDLIVVSHFNSSIYEHMLFSSIFAVQRSCFFDSG